MRKLIYSTEENKEQNIAHSGIPKAEGRGYVRFGIVGGILDHDPMNSNNVCYLASRVTGRKIKVRYHSELHPQMCNHMGQRVMITGLRYYDMRGKLDSMDAEIIEHNDMQ